MSACRLFTSTVLVPFISTKTKCSGSSYHTNAHRSVATADVNICCVEIAHTSVSVPHTVGLRGRCLRHIKASAALILSLICVLVGRTYIAPIGTDSYLVPQSSFRSKALHRPHFITQSVIPAISTYIVLRMHIFDLLALTDGTGIHYLLPEPENVPYTREYVRGMTQALAGRLSLNKIR